jgi:hypothetical protein
MGYRKVPTIYTIKPENYKGLEVRMSGTRIGKVRRLINLQESEDEKTIEMLDEMVKLIVDNLVSWNLEDEEGNPLPADKEQVEELELPMVLDIIGGWVDSMTGVPDDLGKDSASGSPSPVELVTMEAL